jgi:signal transduction histidine kinase
MFQTMRTLIYLDPDSTRHLAIQALEYVNQQSLDEWKIILLNLIGVSYSLQSNYFKALEYHHAALDLSLKSDFPERTGDTYNNLGGINFHIRNNKDALENYLKAAHYYELAGQPYKVALAHSNIGVLSIELNNTEKALYHLKRGLAIFTKQNDSIRLCETYYQIGVAYLKNNQPDSAMHFIDISINMAKDSKNLYNLSVSYKEKADVYLEMFETDEAIEYYRRSKDVAEKINNRSLIGNAYIGLSYTYLKLKLYNKALANANHALKIVDSSNDIKDKLDVYTLLSNIFEETGDFKKSLNYYKLADEINQKIYDQSKLHQIYNMEIMQLSKDKEIQRLKIEQQDLVLSRRNMMMLLLGILFLTIIVIVILTYYFYVNRIKQRQKIKMNEAQVKYTEDRAKAALEAELQERKRLGIELHDGVGPLLSLAKMNVAVLLTKKHFTENRKTTILENTLDTVNEVLKELKQISHNMAPAILIEKGFEAAVRTLVTKLNETNNFKVFLDMFGLECHMEPYFEHALYRSVLEIINNTVCHANATEIDIQIIQNNKDLTIMIEDNGIGFDTEEKLNGKGMGLKSTASRIDNLNGQFFIDSAKGMGTIVTMIIPLTQNKKNGKD